VSVDLELWTRETGDLGALLPRAEEWDDSGELLEFDGGSWLVSVFQPEDAPAEVPAELSGLIEGLRYRIVVGVEPSVPDAEAWTLVRQVLEALGGALGGAGLDPESGRPMSWAR
jgi:hypothetical protein